MRRITRSLPPKGGDQPDVNPYRLRYADAAWLAQLYTVDGQLSPAHSDVLTCPPSWSRPTTRR
jgi:hypothetical protein